MQSPALFGRRLFLSWHLPAVVASAILTSATASRGETVAGVFSDIQTSGSYILEGGLPAYLNNNATAVFDIINNTSPFYPYNPSGPVIVETGPSILRFGANLVLGYSYSGGSILFTGKEIPADPTQPFDLGSVTFVNGLGDAPTDIFGAKLTLYATSNGTTSTAQPHGTAELGILTTQDFSVTAHADLLEPDLITLSGTGNHYLSVPEGRLAVAELFGRILDGRIQTTDLVLSYGDAGSFVGTPAVPVPETSGLLAGWALLGIIGFSGFQHWHKRGPVFSR